MPVREDVEGITLHLKDGADIYFDEVSVTENATEYAEKGVPAGKGEPVRYLTIIAHMAT
jgi:hypothetical protein